ncbi:MAG: STT3 domain-containing protein [Nanoarchaeota archaeon]|nr:STT3 domain-containing protein [Nanoarchaeota archaeon]
MDKQENIIDERKKNFISFLKKEYVWVGILLIIALILGIYIRALPMTDHGGNPGLWDITTNSWTLGPDLDPFLFLRYAKIIAETGSLPSIDMFRNVPLGFDTSLETPLISYGIFWLYSFLQIFDSQTSIDYAAVLFPVIMFGFTIIFFFLFVREIFTRKGEKEENIKANIIALISTFLMIVSPAFLSRTVAGIPEKESAGFMFMFLAFYLFISAWKSEKLRNTIILGALAGIATALMGLSWGGVMYLFIGIGIASLIAFTLNKIHKKEFIVYSLWMFFSFITILLFSNKYPIRSLLESMDTGLAFLVFFILIVHFALWNTKLKDINFINKIKLPKNIVSVIIAFILLFFVIIILFGPSFVSDKINVINQLMFQPVTGRWNTTVAENRQPYFTEWVGNFGPFLKNIPVLFWLFAIGSVVLFRKILNKINKKDAWILTSSYVFFFLGMVFSRYAAHPSLFDGDGLLSKSFFYISALLLIGLAVYYYLKYNKEENKGLEKIDFEYILLFSLFILCLFTARSAVRLIMTLSPIATIFVGYLIIESIDQFKKAKDSTMKTIMAIAVIILLLLSMFVFWNFYNSIKAESYNFVPSGYTQQWQKAMDWVRINTPTDAVFAHWWDYGYWVQSIGNRATVTDGGNAIAYWNYLTGRYVLTGDNQHDALEFLHTHNATYLLIDSTDIGKYGAYSSIGSDINFDRYSWIPVMVSNQNEIQETSEGITRVYQSPSYIDEDINYNLNGTKIFLPSGKAALIGVILEIKNQNGSMVFKQPDAVFFNNNQQIKIPLRYVQYKGQLFDYKQGLEGTFRVTENIIQGPQGVQVDSSGAGIYISPRIMRGMFAQIYLLNDPYKKFDSLKLAYSEPSPVVASLRSQGMKDIDDFVYFNGIQGPIKIWTINYKGNEVVNPEYLLRAPPANITWQF